MPVEVGSSVVATTAQVSAELQDEAIVLGLEKGMYYELDQVAALVWKLIVTPHRVSDIRDQVMVAFDVDEATCERDLLVFLGQLLDEGLIEVHDAQPA